MEAFSIISPHASPHLSDLRSHPSYHRLGLQMLESEDLNVRAMAICRLSGTIIMAERQRSSPPDSSGRREAVQEEPSEALRKKIQGFQEGKCLVAFIQMYANLSEFEKLCEKCEQLKIRASVLKVDSIACTDLQKSALGIVTHYLSYRPGLLKFLNTSCEDNLNLKVYNLTGWRLSGFFNNYALLQAQTKRWLEDFSEHFASLFKQLERLLGPLQVNMLFLQAAPSFAEWQKHLEDWDSAIKDELTLANELYRNEKTSFEAAAPSRYLTGNLGHQMDIRAAAFDKLVKAKFSLAKELSKENILRLTGGEPCDLARAYEARRLFLCEGWQEAEKLARQLAQQLDILTDALRYHRFPKTTQEYLIEKGGALLPVFLKDTLSLPFCTRFANWLTTGLDPQAPSPS